MLILAAGAYPAGVTALRIAAEHHALNDVSDVSLLIEGDFISQAEVAVALPVVEEYFTKAVVPDRVVERLPGVVSFRWGCFSGYCVPDKRVMMVRITVWIALQVPDQSRFRDVANPAYLPVLQSEAFDVDRFHSLLHFRVRMLITFEVKRIQLFWSEFDLDHSWPHIRFCPPTMPQSG
jgi:hypothetical protein